MIKFGQLVEEGMATFKVNPVTRAYGVIIYLDQLKKEYEGKKHFIIINDKEYQLTENKFKSNIKDVTLDTNDISEKELINSEIKIYK